MTKAELIVQLAQDHPHLDVKDAEKIVSTIFDNITAALARGQRIELRGFGNFTARQRNPRAARNPRTGTALSIEKKTVPFFKAGKELSQRVNQSRLPLGRSRAPRKVKRQATLSFHLTNE